jgi:hypothetical protein
MPDEEERPEEGMKRARTECDHRAYLIEWDNMVTGGEPPFDPAGTEREFAKKAYESDDWSLGNILSWIAFVNPALICRFEPRWTRAYFSKGQWRDSRHLTSRQRLMLYRQRPMLYRKRRPMLVERPDHVLLAALQANRLTAIRDGRELPSVYWFGKDAQHLTEDLRFRRVEAIKCWHRENHQPEAVPDEAAIISQSMGIAEAKADEQVGGREGAALLNPKPKRIPPTPTQLDTWMQDNYRKGDKRDPTIKACCTQTGARWRDAVAAYKRLPAELRRIRGGRDR